MRVAEQAVVGGFRGEGPVGSLLSTADALINWHLGAPPCDVGPMVRAVFQQLDTNLDRLDARLAAGEGIGTIYPDVLGVAAQIHGDWVRIHPFVDHNGSTARLLCLAVGLRYGVPFNLPGKPRSLLAADGLLADYEQAANNQMLGDDRMMIRVLHSLVQNPGN